MTIVLTENYSGVAKATLACESTYCRLPAVIVEGFLKEATMESIKELPRYADGYLYTHEFGGGKDYYLVILIEGDKVILTGSTCLQNKATVDAEFILLEPATLDELKALFK